MHRRPLVLAALGTASVLTLAGCASTPAEPASTDDGTLNVVASTSVYGQIVQEIGGDAVDVTSIVTSTAQDPHSFEASARDQLTVQRADLIIENGGGYDAFIDGLIEASGTKAPVLTAVEYSHDWPGDDGHDHGDDDHADGDHADDDHDHADEDHDHADGDHAGHDHIEGFNEHVWYDPHTVAHFAEAIADELGELDPAQAETFSANADAFIAQVDDLESQLETLAQGDAGRQVFVTEPVPLYLTAAAGLENATPSAFSEAVEEGQDVPPATLLESLDILRSGDVSVVIVNAQTGGAETTQITQEADADGIPVIEFSETLPDGSSYIQWMQQNIDALTAALAG